jgi:nicotinamide-nucleotide adenylyltransferase
MLLDENTRQELVREVAQLLMKKQRLSFASDFHAFADGRQLTLAGVTFETFLKGPNTKRSDGDVVAHAIVMALAAAVNRGDIDDMSIRVNPRLLHYYRRVHRLLECLNPKARPWAVVSPGSAIPREGIIVFPGSFNPPTRAHLALLRQARKFANRQGGHWQIYAAMSKQIVDKEAVERMTLLDRIVLLERVLKDKVKGAGILLLNKGLYVEQAEGIRAAFPQVCRLYFLLGFDKMVQILDPRYYTDRDAALRELFRQSQLLVAPRGAEGGNELRQLLALPENRPFASSIHPLDLATEYRNISSTQARQNQTACPGTLPAEVWDFVERTRPYAPPLRGKDNTEIDLYAERTHALGELLSE